MTFVDHYCSVIFVGQRTDLIQLCNGTVHTKRTIRNNDPVPGAGSLHQFCLQVSHIIVFKPETLGLTEPDTVYDRSVIQFIRNNSVLLIEKGFKYTTIGIKGS